MSYLALAAIKRSLDVLAEAKSDEGDSFVIGCLAACEDALEEMAADIAQYMAEQ